MNEQQVLQAFGALQEALRSSQDSNVEALRLVAGQIDRQGAALQTSLEQNARFLQSEQTSRRRVHLIDTKVVGKPSAFSGKESEWPAWSYKFVTWISGQFEGGEDILDWAANMGE